MILIQHKLMAYLELHAEDAQHTFDPPYITGDSAAQIVKALEILKERLREGVWPDDSKEPPLTRHYIEFCKKKMGEL